MKILFVYKDLLHKGGMPQEIRNLLNSLDANNVDIVVLCEIVPHDFLVNKNIDIVSIENNISKKYIEDNLFCVCVFVGFSDISNIRISRYALRKKTPYVVLPLSQINSFLDYDNPFEKDDLPDVKLLEKRTNELKDKKSRVKNGSKDISAYFKKLRRVIFRKTLGKIFLRNAKAIGVFSAFEQNEINFLFPNNTFYYFHYFFGADMDMRKLGNDQYPDDNKINIVMWGRVDYYYKGIDKIILALSEIKEKVKNIRINIIGPDYNQGYHKLLNAVNEFGLTELVRIVKPGEYTSGTFGLLAEADVSILLSRWDGFPRALRESISLGIPIIVSKEVHFDTFVYKYKIGFIVDKKNELANIFLEIDKNPTILLDLKSNTEKITNKLSLDSAAIQFKENMKKLIRS